MNYKYILIGFSLLFTVSFAPAAYGVSLPIALEAIAFDPDQPYLGLGRDKFQRCFIRNNLFKEMFDETYPGFEEAQAAIETLALARQIDLIPRGELTNHLSGASKKEWANYKRAYGYVSFLAGPSLGGIYTMARGAFFSEMRNYSNNYSLNSIYSVYIEARNRGKNHYGALRTVENWTLGSHKMSASWYNVVGLMQKLSYEFDLGVTGENLLGRALEYEYNNPGYHRSVNIEMVIERFLRGRAIFAKEAAIKSLLRDPYVQRCLEKPDVPSVDPKHNGQDHVVWLDPKDRMCCAGDWNGVAPYRYHGTTSSQVRQGAIELNRFSSKEEAERWVCNRTVHRSVYKNAIWAKINGYVVKGIPCSSE